MKKTALKFQVWQEWVNYCGEVVDEFLIATFLYKGWAEEYIEKCLDDSMDGVRFVIRERD